MNQPVAETRMVSHRDNGIPKRECFRISCSNRVIIKHLDVTSPAVALVEKPVMI